MSSLFRTIHLLSSSFSIFAVESLGGWHETAAAQLGSALARQTGVTVQRLFQQLSVALMWGNAAIFNNRFPAQDAMAIRGDDVIW